MLSENVLSVVCSYLDLTDLLQFLKVNRKFNKAASSPTYYKAEFTRIFMTGTDSHTTKSKQWKALCVSMLRQESVFCSLSKDIANKHSLNTIFNRLTDILARPELPFPKLRRDTLTYPTPVQDLFANLNEPQLGLCENFGDEFKFFEVEAFSDTEKFLVLLMKPFVAGFCKVITNFCEAAFLKIQETEIVFESYLDTWENFTFAIQNLCEYVFPLFERIRSLVDCVECKEITSFCYDLHGFMIKIWKEKVLFTLQEKLNCAFVENLRKIFENGEAGRVWMLCKRYSEALFDASINEFSVHFKNHSKTEWEGPIRALECVVVEYFETQRIHTEEDFERLDLVIRLFPASINRAVVEKLDLESNWENDYEEFINHMQAQDYTIEFTTKQIGLSQSDIGFYSRCKNVELVDLLLHVSQFKEDVCN